MHNARHNTNNVRGKKRATIKKVYAVKFRKNAQEKADNKNNEKTKKKQRLNAATKKKKLR